MSSVVKLERQRPSPRILDAIDENLASDADHAARCPSQTT
jgi:hypothetical protein